MQVKSQNVLKQMLIIMMMTVKNMSFKQLILKSH